MKEVSCGRGRRILRIYGIGGFGAGFGFGSDSDSCAGLVVCC